MFQIFHLLDYVAILFYLSVSKVNLNVGLLSGEERGSVGAMAASMWRGDAGRAASVWKRRGSHPSGVEEVGAKRCERGGRGVGVEETGPNLLGGVSS